MGLSCSWVDHRFYGSEPEACSEFARRCYQGFAGGLRLACGRLSERVLWLGLSEAWMNRDCIANGWTPRRYYACTINGVRGLTETRSWTISLPDGTKRSRAPHKVIASWLPE